MNLQVIGINHNSASVALRERVAFVPEKTQQALQSAQQITGLSEVAILSTCNRTELYAVASADGEDDQARARLLGWLAEFHGLDPSELEQCAYHQRGKNALGHMISVAAGLDSMVLGEPQIFGQMKSAYALAVDADTATSNLHRVFSHVFSVAKRVRTDTAIGENPVSVAYAAVNITQHIFSKLSECTALLIGAGETIELVARHLRDKGAARIIIANRTLERAQVLVDKVGGEAVTLADIPDYLAVTDIVVSSTASQLPILGKGAVESALKTRRHKPMVMVDIAVPRDIESQVGSLPDVYLYTVDDLKEIVSENKRNRFFEARKAEDIISEAVTDWESTLRSLEAVDTVKEFRAKAEQLRDLELQRAQQLLAKGEAPEKVLEALARGITNKLLHSPTTQLKAAAAEGRREFIESARELYQLNERDSQA